MVSTSGFCAGELEQAFREVELIRFEKSLSASRKDVVATEEPLEIRIDDYPIAVVMRTPGHDAELATGFLCSEGVIGSVSEIASLRHCSVVPIPEAEDNVLQVRLQPGVQVDMEALRRNIYASSSCGICGKASIESALKTAPPLCDASRFSAALLARVPDRLRSAQRVFERTGGLHAAALFDGSGELLVAREDIGRHNAVDKVIGWALREERLPLTGHLLAVSGRVSFEIVQKALAARIPIVAAVSAPSSLAVELAEQTGLTLVAFLRGENFNVYSFPERVMAS